MGCLAALAVSAIAAVVAWQFWPRTYVGTCEVEVAGGSTDCDAAFQARCVCKDVARAESLECLADRIVKSSKAFEKSRADVLDLLGLVKTSIVGGTPTVIRVVAESGSREMSRLIVEQFAGAIVHRIAEDAKSLDETMEKWFATQIHHKRNRNEDVSQLEKEMAQAMKDTASKAMTAKIKQVTVCEK